MFGRAEGIIPAPSAGVQTIFASTPPVNGGRLLSRHPSIDQEGRLRPHLHPVRRARFGTYAFLPRRVKPVDILCCAGNQVLAEANRQLVAGGCRHPPLAAGRRRSWSSPRHADATRWVPATCWVMPIMIRTARRPDCAQPRRCARYDRGSREALKRCPTRPPSRSRPGPRTAIVDGSFQPRGGRSPSPTTTRPSPLSNCMLEGRGLLHRPSDQFGPVHREETTGRVWRQIVGKIGTNHILPTSPRAGALYRRRSWSASS